MHLNIKTLTINVGRPAPALASALFSSLFRDDAEDRVSGEVTMRPIIGEYVPGQGGVFVGDFRGDDGSICGLILAEGDLGTKTWGPSGAIEGLSEWDGLANTKALIAKGGYSAAKAAAEYTRDGHSDFYLPSRRELQLAAANVPHLCKPEYHWSSTPRGDYTWAVDFENGLTGVLIRGDEFRVSPFRRFIY